MDAISALPKLNAKQLDELARDCDILTKGLSRSEIIAKLTALFKQQIPDSKYTRLEQLGKKGKEGTVFLVKDKRGKKHAMKVFSKSKSEKNLEREAILLKKASEFKISPSMLDYNLSDNYIVMEKLEKSLFDYIKENKGKLSSKIQNEMINIFKTLDKIKVFHADPNPLNFMFDSKGDLKIIDFGFAKPIDDKMTREHGTENVNMKFMPLGFILKMSQFVPATSFTVLLKYVSAEDKEKIGIINDK